MLGLMAMSLWGLMHLCLFGSNYRIIDCSHWLLAGDPSGTLPMLFIGRS
ncbi:hypothetical protein TR2A62_0098 [Thalassobium sp. R2A62]|nr:hypothetical protein TR2A62_0098 [Thalassobium sp. R2A62]